VDVEHGAVLGTTAAPLVTLDSVEHEIAPQFEILKRFDARNNLVTCFPGNPQIFIAPPPPGENFAIVGSLTLPKRGIESLMVTGLLRPDLDALVGTVPAVRMSEERYQRQFWGYPDIQTTYGAELVQPLFVVDGALMEPREAVRMRPGTRDWPQVLVRLGRPLEGIEEAAALVEWSPTRPSETRKALADDLVPGLYVLESATPDAAVLSVYDLDVGMLNWMLVDFRTGTKTTYIGRDIGQDYVLLAPKYLYNITDTQFHTTDPELRRTALPRPLAPAPTVPPPRAAYHLLRLP
jgi:hypothetical protein